MCKFEFIILNMSDLNKYLQDVLGTEVNSIPIDKPQLGGLPFYIGQSYEFNSFRLFNREILLVKPIHEEELNIQQVAKNIDLIRKEWPGRVPVLTLKEINAINRKRLIAKGINFIVPNKQMFLPDLLIDLQESFASKKRVSDETLTPSAQFLVIYHLLHKRSNWNLEENSFKAIAEKFNYTAMAITKAADNLRYLELAEIAGAKEKYIRFRMERQELWQYGLNRKLFSNPVLKRFFTDERPENNYMLMSNASALPEYSDMNPSRQKYFAMAKSAYYLLPKNSWRNVNDFEGNYCIEVWKYDPLALVNELNNDSSVVDPLSLYLSLRDNKDERVEMALEQIIERQLW